MQQPFYCKMQQKFITKCVMSFIIKCYSFITKCVDFATKCDSCYNICLHNSQTLMPSLKVHSKAYDRSAITAPLT